MLNRIKLVLAAGPLFLLGCANQQCCCPDHSRCQCAVCNPGYKSADNAGQLQPPAPVAITPAISGQPSTSGVYKVRPAKMVAVIEGAVARMGMKVESSKDGVIQTSWKEGYDGKVHIMRKWQERTRFRISVIPDVNDPVNACRVEVIDESQERSNDRAPYEANPQIHRPERAQELISEIDKTLAS